MIRETMLSLAASRERPDRASIEELVRTYLRTLDTGDIEGRLALFAPDASFEDPVGTPAIVGHAALRAFWAGGAGLDLMPAAINHTVSFMAGWKGVAG